MLCRRQLFLVTVGVVVAFGVENTQGQTPSLLSDLWLGVNGSYPNCLTAINGELYFGADDGVHGWELWKTDGTEAGTTLVKDILPGGFGSSSEPESLTEYGGDLFFQAADGTHGYELWKSDGTEVGTVLVKDINPTGHSTPNHSLIAIAEELFFRANDGIHGFELWKTDGTEAGTVLVKDIWPGANGSILLHFTDMCSQLFFVADDGTHGRELWKSDGTEAGTEIVKDIRPGANSSSIDNLTEFDGALYFKANDGTNNLTHGTELWKSDGTEAGTEIVKDINPTGGSSPSNLTVVNGELYFGAQDGVHGRELWKSDGTEAGTVLVKDINSGGNSSPGHFTWFNGANYFKANDGIHGGEPWKTDGSEAGTVLIKDIRAGVGGSNPGTFAELDGALYFGAEDGTHGRELWKSDGTEAGTEIVKDIRPGANSSSIDNLTEFDGALYFGANDGTHGKELWVLSLNSTPECDAGTSLAVEWEASITDVALDGSASSDPDGDPLSYAWSTTCAGATFNDPSLEMPTLTFNSFAVTTVNCMATLTVMDPSGEVDSCDVMITLDDTTAPDIDCPSDVELECPADTPVAENGAASATDNCDPNPVITSSDDVTDDCGSTQTIVRTWTAIDASGNVRTCDQTITVVDTTHPSIDTTASNLTVECDGSGNTTELHDWLAARGDAIASDTCGDVSWSNDFSALSDDCGATGSATVTFTATDECLRTAMTTATFTIEDDTEPDITCPDDVTIECTEDTSSTTQGVASATDSCSAAMDITIDESDVVVAGTCPQERTITRTWTATDECGNSLSCDQTITVVDITAPVISCPTATTLEANVFVGGICGYSANLNQATATDNCGDVTVTDDVSYPVPLPIGNTTLTWTATDECGNSSSCPQLITVEDTIPPEALCQAVTIFLSATGQASITPAQIDNGSGDLCGIASLELSQTLFDCTHLGANTVTLTVTDNNGNSSTCTANVTVRDTIDPTITCPTDTVRSANSSCGWVPEDNGGASNLGLALADDNCPDGLLASNNAPATLGLGTTLVTWTATDSAGNSTTCEQVVTVIDDTPPMLVCPPDTTQSTNLSGQFVPLAGGAGLAGVIVSDNCGGAIAISNDAPTSFAVGTTVVTYVASDAAGNSTSCTQAVTVVDTTPPAITCPVALTVESNAGCSWVGDFGEPAVIDAESDDALIFVTNDAPGAFPMGINTITWTATDPTGNSSTCTQQITVLDLEPPTVFCPGGPRNTTCTDPRGAVVEFETSGTDNCGDENITLVCEPPSGSLFPPGLTTVLCTATDDSGNTATCSFDVTVECGGFVLPGDCDGNGAVDLTDAVCILSILFSNTGRRAPCGDGSIQDPPNVALLSWNGTDDVDLTSAVALLNFKFLGGPPHALGRNCVPILDCPEVCR